MTGGNANGRAGIERSAVGGDGLDMHERGRRCSCRADWIHDRKGMVGGKPNAAARIGEDGLLAFYALDAVKAVRDTEVAQVGAGEGTGEKLAAGHAENVIRSGNPQIPAFVFGDAIDVFVQRGR